MLSKLSKFLSYALVLEGGFGVMKSSRITNWIKRSAIERVILPGKVVNSKLLKKNIVD